jgi:dimethylargininase
VSAALVREPSPRLAQAELTHVAPRPIDAALARAQHAGYVAELERRGREVVALPPRPEHPDGVFVEDVAVVLGDDLAVVTRPGAEARRGETSGLAEVLAARGLRVAAIEAPGTLDGGDVLQVDGTVFAGRSTRTNAAGIAQLAALAAPHGRRVVPVDVTGALHLKTAATALPGGPVLAVTRWLDPAPFAAHGLEVVEAPEPAGANVLVLGAAVVLTDAAPRTAELIAAHDLEPVPLAMSEFDKAEGSVTCLSVLLPR